MSEQPNGAVILAELGAQSTSRSFLQVRQDGSRAVRGDILHSNLDANILVGCQLKSNVATQVRTGATARRNDELAQGCVITQQRLDQAMLLATASSKNSRIPLDVRMKLDGAK